MNRRTFLASIGAAVVGVPVASQPWAADTVRLSGMSSIVISPAVYRLVTGCDVPPMKNGTEYIGNHIHEKWPPDSVAPLSLRYREEG